MDVPQMALAQEVEVLIPTLASLPMAVMITDCNGVVQFVNPPLEALAGYAADNLIGQPAGLVVSGTSIQENIQTVAASGQPWKGESLCRQKSGACGSGGDNDLADQGNHGCRNPLPGDCTRRT